MNRHTPGRRLLPVLALLPLLAAPATGRGQTLPPAITREEVQRSLDENRAAWQAKIETVGRPRLVYDRAQLAEVKARLLGGERASETTAMLAKAYQVAGQKLEAYLSPQEMHDKRGETMFSANGEEWVRVVGDEIGLLSIAAALDPSPILKKGVHDWTVAACRYPSWGRKGNLPADNMDLACGHMLKAVALAWDWHPELWTPEERDLILKTVDARAGSMLSGLYGQGFWSRGYTDNHNHVDCAGMGLAGLAFFTDLPQAPEWLAAARLDFQNVARYCPADGSSAEGVPYWSYGMTFVLEYIEGTRGIIDSASMYDAPYLKHSAAFRLNVSTCGLGGTLPWGDAPPRDYYGPQHILTRFANQYHDPSAAWLAHGLPWTVGGSDLLAWAALWAAPESADRPPLPLDYHLDVADLVNTRSGWGPGDYLLAIKSGFTNRNHCHLDAGALALAFGPEWLLTTSGYGLGKNSEDYWDGNGKRWTFYANATESQCTLLIDGKNQRFDRSARGTVDQFLSMPEGSFTGIDLTQAYAGVESVRREVLHQRGDYILVLDKVRSKERVRVEWLAQLAAEPESKDRALTLKGEHGQIRVQTLGGGGAFEPRKPTSAHVDVPPQKLHTYASRSDGAAVDFAVLIQPGFSRDALPPLTVETKEVKPGMTDYLVRGEGWWDHVLESNTADQAELAVPGTNGAATVAAFAHLLTVRADAKGARSALAVRAGAFRLPGVIEVQAAEPAEIAVQKTPDGSWVLDADKDLAKAVHPAEGFTLEALDSLAGANTFRWLLLARGANRQASVDWLASRLMFRERSQVVVRAPAAQGPLPASVTVSFLAATFQGQRDGAAEVVEGKPGSTAAKTLRGFGNDSPQHAVDWQFTAAQAGQYQLLVRYATALPNAHFSALLDGALPGQEFANLTLPGTGGWSIHEDNWKMAPLCDAAGKPLVFHLSAGKHELRLANPSGALALDKFEFRGMGK